MLNNEKAYGNHNAILIACESGLQCQLKVEKYTFRITTILNVKNFNSLLILSRSKSIMIKFSISMSKSICKLSNLNLKYSYSQ